MRSARPGHADARPAASLTDGPQAAEADASPPPNGAERPEAQALLEALRAVARELRLTEQRERPQLGLPPAQLRVLRELSLRPAESLGELAGRTYTDPSSASVVVQRLVERGLVQRVESEVDRRRTALTVSAEGRALAARAPADAVTRVADAIMPLGEAQAAVLARGLRVLARELRGEHDDGEDDDAATAARDMPANVPADSASGPPGRAPVGD